MPIDRHTGEFISLTDAEMLTKSYQDNFPNAIKCFYLGANKIQDILDQEGCIGIRTYMAFDKDTNTQNLVMVGVNEDCEDMTDGLIADKMMPCPSQCDNNSPLVY